MGAHARRVVAAAAALFMSGDLQATGTPHRQIPDFSWAAHLERLNDAEFKQRYRVTKSSFNKLLGILKTGLNMENDKQAARARNGKPIEPEVRYLQTLASNESHSAAY